jgi:hypothetical protein
MTQKTTRKYEILSAMARGEGDSAKNLAELCAIDYATAMEVWEFYLGKSDTLALSGFEVFRAVSESKLRQTLCENSALMRLVFMSSAALSAPLVDFLVSIILSTKTEMAGEILKIMRTNTAIDQNECMRVVVDAVFNVACARDGTKVATLNKKQKTLLIENIEKIKGQNKALLLQRIKEIG